MIAINARAALLLLILFLLGGCRGASAFDLDVGECFNQPESGSAVGEVELVECDEPHDFEVFHLVDVEDGEFPGESAVNEFADVACAAAFEGYVGRDYQSSGLYVSYLHPTAASWAEGDREVVCLLRMDNGQLSGSMRGSER